MGHVVSMERTRKKLKSSPNKSSVASIPVLTNHISQYLSKEDLASIHSTSKTQSEAASKNITYVEAKCTVETVYGLTCNTESVPASCTHWCKQKKTSSSLMRFYAFLKLFSHEGATFKFENQPADYTQFDVEISETNKISLLPYTSAWSDAAEIRTARIKTIQWVGWMETDSRGASILHIQAM